MAWKVPFLTYDQMAAKAAIFLDKYNNGDTEPPIDIEFLLEKADLVMIPIPGLKKNHDIDGFLSGDMNHIYVDEKQYMHEHSYRFRFTLAHEAAHLIAHQQLLLNLGVNEPENSQGGVRGLPQHEYDSFEWQANTIAGMILVPESDLKSRVEKLKGAVLRDDMDIDEKTSVAADNLYKMYKVTRDVVAFRIEKEELID